MLLPSAYMVQKSERERGDCSWALLGRRGELDLLEFVFYDKELAMVCVIGVAGAP
jgi:hypothetical protein